MMSASEADRDLVYFTFNSIDTTNKLKKLYEIITRANLNISQVYKMILDFSDFNCPNTTDYQSDHDTNIERRRVESPVPLLAISASSAF